MGAIWSGSALFQCLRHVQLRRSPVRFQVALDTSFVIVALSGLPYVTGLEWSDIKRNSSVWLKNFCMHIQPLFHTILISNNHNYCKAEFAAHTNMPDNLLNSICTCLEPFKTDHREDTYTTLIGQIGVLD